MYINSNTYYTTTPDLLLSKVAALVGAMVFPGRRAACAPNAAPMARPFSMQEAPRCLMMAGYGK